MGGDEFMLMLTDSTTQDAAFTATQLRQVIAEPYHIELNELIVTPSIGIAMYPEDGEDFVTLYRHADTAMYRAKLEGRNDYRFFTQEMQSLAVRTLKIENALRYAITRNELQLHYQPQLSLTTGHIVGVEALLRWQHAELGNLSPTEFIPIAERSGQIIKIGEWVSLTAVDNSKLGLILGTPPMVMAVNLSAVQFRHPDLLGFV